MARKKLYGEIEHSHQLEFQVTRLPPTGARTDKPTQSAEVLYRQLNPILEDLEDYCPVQMSSLLPHDRFIRKDCITFLKRQGVGYPAFFFSCNYRGNVETLHFLWTAPALEDANKQAAVIEQIRKDIPVYHAKYIKKRFAEQARFLNVKPMHARYLFKLATQDASASPNEVTKQVDGRLLEFAELKDEELVVDLRTLTQADTTAFEDFFNVAGKVIESTVETAVDERRHDSVVHLAKAMSGADLYR